jgi:hypothetical protein
MESTKEDSITKLLVIDFLEGVRVIMIGCFFIQTDKMTLEGQKRFIHTHQMIFVIDVGFRHPNFNIKGSIIYSTLLLSFHYCYVVKIYTNFFVKMRGNINKEMVEKMKMRDKKEKMVVNMNPFLVRERPFF